MADTIREQIIQNIIAKMAIIRTANAYNTECGKLIKRAELIPVDSKVLPALSVFPMPEIGEERYGQRILRIMEMRIQAIDNLKSINASIVSERILADLIECIFGIVWTMNFDSGGTFEPQPGHEIEGETDGETAIIQAVSLDSGTWAGGDAAGSFILRRVSGVFGNNETLQIHGNADVATVDGALTGQDPKETTTGDLADSLDYVSGGTEEYPTGQNDIVGAGIVMNIGYKTLTGDPYTQ